MYYLIIRNSSKRVRQDASISALTPTDFETKFWLLLNLEHNNSAL